MVNYSSGNDDENRSLLDNSGMNVSASAAATVVTKRKYVKRKKLGPDGQPLPTQTTATPSGDASAGQELTKLDSTGTKLIIKTKAIMSMANDSLLDGSGVSPVKKKYKTNPTKKQLKLLEQQFMSVASSEFVSASTGGDSLEPGEKLVAPKLKIVVNKPAAATPSNTNKSNESIKITIPKEKLTTPSSNNNNEVFNFSNNNQNSGTGSPAGGLADVMSSIEAVSSLMMSQTPNQSVNPQKRQYNKQNSLLKKQQKLLQQQQQQIDQFSAQSPLASAFANLLDPQQFLMALQQQQQQQFMPNTSAATSAAFGSSPNLFTKQVSNTNQKRKSTSSQQQASASGQQQQQQSDYLTKPHKKVDRRHADPLVSFTSLLENILNELRDTPEVNLYSVHFTELIKYKSQPFYSQI
jgi:hypothetical protein